MTDTVTRLMKHADNYALLNRISPSDAATFAARQALEAELTRLFTPLNQCDGCMAGLPLRSGLHIDTDGKALMLCQKSKYEADNEANERNLCQLTDELAESRREVAQLQEQNTALDARLASNEAVMRVALGALLTVANPKAPAAIKALEEQLK